MNGRGGDRRVVAVLGDGALTGGMAYEALNNLGHSGRRVVMVLNDNGRSYAPTVSKLSESLTHLRLNPHYVQARQRVRHLLKELPGVGEIAYSGVHGLTNALREVVTPHRFFETLGVRYVGPIDGHDIDGMEQAFAHAAAWDGPILVHVLTQKGRGYTPAEDDDVQRLHDVKVQTNSPIAPSTYTDAFTRALLDEAEKHPDLVAITAAMPGPTGLLPFQAAHPERFVDVGIAEQHAVTMAAGLALGQTRPVVAVYATFFSRAFDQANLDVGLHELPVVFILDRAGITGDDGPSHHGLLDLAQALSIPGMTVFAPSCADDVALMLHEALQLPGPSTIRFPKTAARHLPPEQLTTGLHARQSRIGDGSVCLLAVGKLVEAAEDAAEILAASGIEATVWDVRVVSPPDPTMLADAARHPLVVTVEDGVRQGGAGMFLLDAMASQFPPAGSVPAPVTRVLGVPRAFIAQSKPDRILAQLGLDGPGIAGAVREALGGRAGSSHVGRVSSTPSRFRQD